MPDYRNLGNELGTLTSWLPTLAGAQYNAANQYGLDWTTLNNSLLDQSLLGRSTFDANAYLASRPDLQNNWNSDTAGYTDTYGSLENYAQADWARWSNDPTYVARTGGVLNTLEQAAPRIDALNAASATAQRTSDIADVTNLGGAAAAAYRAANPELTGYMSGLENRIANARNVTYSAATPTLGQANQASLATAYGSPLMSQLEQDAAQDLGNAGYLSREGQRTASQAARQAFADRGMVGSNAAIFQEAMNSEALRQQREDRARANALQVSAQGNSLSTFNAGQANTTNQFNATAANNFALADYQGQLQNNQFNANLALNADNSQYNRELALGNMYAAQAVDPYAMVLGRGVTNSTTTNTALGQAGGTVSTGGNTMDSLLSYGSDLYNTNLNAQASLEASSANNQSALLGAGIQGLSSIGGAAMIASSTG